MFCTRCGVDLTPQESEAQDIGDPGTLQENSSLAALERKVNRLETEIAAIRSLLNRHESIPDRIELTSVLDRPAQSHEPPLSSSTSGSEPPDFALRMRHRLSSIDWEQVLGLNWLAIVGTVALAIGVGFFLKLAFENNWIGPTGRIILGVSIGITLLVIGEYCQRRFPAWAQAVTGGGIGILYLSVYAAFEFFTVLDPIPALLFLTLVVVLSGLLALRHESLTIALLGIFGAYLAPALLDSGIHSDQYYILLVYILLVGLGVFGVSMFRNWRWLTLLGLLASYSLFGVYADRIPDQDLIMAQAGVTANFLVFVGATTLFHIVWRRDPKPTDMTLMTLNAAAYFGITYGLLWEQYQEWFGLITLAMTLFYGLVSYGAIRRSGTSPQVALYSLGTSLIFLTIAIPIQLTGSWITVAWVAQGAVLLWVGFMTRSWPTRAFGFVGLALSAVRLLVFDTTITLEDFRIIFNSRFLTFALCIAILYLVAYLYRRNIATLERWEANVHLILFGFANFFTLWILSVEVISYFGDKAVIAGSHQARIDAENIQILSLTPLWAIYSVGLLAIALARGSRVLRWAGLALLAAPALKLIVVDTFAVDFNRETHTLIANFHFLSSITVIGALVFAAFLYRRHEATLLNAEKYAFRILIAISNIITVWVLSAEAIRFFDTLEIRDNQSDSKFTNAKYLALTVLWTVYAIAVIAAGIVRRSSKLRLIGLVVLGIPVLKLFVFDVFQLEQEYRVAAFAALGILLLTTGLAYQWRRKAIKEFLVGDPF